jgi:hypothetical protein
MSVSSATVRTRALCPSSTMVPASSRAVARSFMNAPEPTLTSRTSAPVPSAIFLLMIELAIKRDGLDRAGDVAQRVQLAVGRRQAVAAAQMTAPDLLQLAA